MHMDTCSTHTYIACTFHVLKLLQGAERQTESHQTMGGGGRRSGGDQCRLAPCVRGQHVETRACTACAETEGAVAQQAAVMQPAIAKYTCY